MVNIVWEEQKDKQCQRSNKAPPQALISWGACSEEVFLHTSIYDDVSQQIPSNFIFFLTLPSFTDDLGI